MRYYPVFMKLTGRECLVVGAGEVGLRKIAKLVQCGAGKVVVIDTRRPDEDMKKLAAEPNVEFHCREFVESDLDGKWLVIASTSSEEVNWRISNLCAERGILCNIVDQPEKCSFIVPAMVHRGDLTVAISTGGASPAMAKRIRQDLQAAMGEEYGLMLVLMGRIRPLMLELGLPTSENTAVFRSLAASELLERLGQGDADGAAEVLRAHLPQPLHDHIPELLHELV